MSLAFELMMDGGLPQPKARPEDIVNLDLKSTLRLEINTFLSCCGSESKSGSTGSTCFWASWIGIHESEVWILIRILLSSCKNSKKSLDSYYFVSLLTFIFEEHSKSKKQKKCKKNSFLLTTSRSMAKIAGSRSGFISQKHGSADPDPDPHQNVMDPQHCFL